jgi:hypothetical protein
VWYWLRKLLARNRTTRVPVLVAKSDAAIVGPRVRFSAGTILLLFHKIQHVYVAPSMNDCFEGGARKISNYPVTVTYSSSVFTALIVVRTYLTQQQPMFFNGCDCFSFGLWSGGVCGGTNEKAPCIAHNHIDQHCWCITRLGVLIQVGLTRDTWIRSHEADTHELYSHLESESHSFGSAKSAVKKGLGGRQRRVVQVCSF